MRILHTADLHIGQILYQGYDRRDEHDHFFSQLLKWCVDERPDALVVCGDVFDIQQPSAATWRAFNGWFTTIRRECPDMKIVIVAGNHDSASRLQSHSEVWGMLDTCVVGTAPAMFDRPDGWQLRHIVKMEGKGYIVALPFMAADRHEMVQELLDYVGAVNAEENLPVVMTGHLATAWCDATGHDPEIGRQRVISYDHLGKGFDYLALGHIHKPQTIGRSSERFVEEAEYPSPVVRYSGSALHVSCDETFPHSVSLVDIDSHGGNVKIRQLQIDQLRHFHVLPEDGSSYATAEDALAGVAEFAGMVASGRRRGYFRLRIDMAADLPSDFINKVYATLDSMNVADEARFNPKTIWTGGAEKGSDRADRPEFEVADLQQMANPITFVEKTFDDYADLHLSLSDLRDAFATVERYLREKDE